MGDALRFIGLCVIAVGGCHRPQATVAPPLAPNVSFCEAGYDDLWTAAEDVLRRHRFRLDRTDSDGGVMTTHAVGSQHFFEFWRDDVATARDAWEATLTHVRRRAVVDISRIPDDGGCKIAVTVYKQRFSTPERQITNSAAAGHFLKNTLPGVRSGRAITSLDSYWIDRGRDAAMEDKLRREIIDRAVRLGRPPAGR